MNTGRRENQNTRKTGNTVTNNCPSNAPLLGVQGTLEETPRTRHFPHRKSRFPALGDNFIPHQTLPHPHRLHLNPSLTRIKKVSTKPCPKPRTTATPHKRTPKPNLAHPNQKGREQRQEEEGNQQKNDHTHPKKRRAVTERYIEEEQRTVKRTEPTLEVNAEAITPEREGSNREETKSSKKATVTKGENPDRQPYSD